MAYFTNCVATRDLLELHDQWGAATFADRWRWPCLVRKIDREEVITSETRSFHTRGAASAALADAALRRGQTSDMAALEDDTAIKLDDVLPLRKRPGSTTFEDRIGIGRASNMDVTIELPRISKYHAYVSVVGSTIQVCDARSTFGTFVDGERLEPLTPKASEGNGESVELGPYSFKLYSRRAMIEFLASIARTRTART